MWGCNEGLQLGLEEAGQTHVIELPVPTLQGVQVAAAACRAPIPPPPLIHPPHRLRTTSAPPLQVVAAACSADATLALAADGRVYQLGGEARKAAAAPAPPNSPLELEGRCSGVFGGGGTLGLLLVAGTGGGGGGGNGNSNGGGGLANGTLPPPPSVERLVENFNISPQLAELIGASCEAQSVGQLQDRRTGG